MRSAARQALSGIDVPAAVALVVATTMLIVQHYHGRPSHARALFPGLAQTRGLSGTVPYLFWFGTSVVLFLGVPMIATALTPRIRLRATGIGLGDWRVGLAATALTLALFLPLVAAAAQLPPFASHYPLSSAARDSLAAFVLYEVGYALYFVAWEYLFRGYLLFSLERAMGKLAVFAQMMPFALLHYGKPELETFGSMLAGLFLGALALRTRSFWYGAILHAVVAASMDLLVVYG